MILCTFCLPSKLRRAISHKAARSAARPAISRKGARSVDPTGRIVLRDYLNKNLSVFAIRGRLVVEMAKLLSLSLTDTRLKNNSARAQHVLRVHRMKALRCVSTTRRNESLSQPAARFTMPATTQAQKGRLNGSTCHVHLRKNAEDISALYTTVAAEPFARVKLSATSPDSERMYSKCMVEAD